MKGCDLMLEQIELILVELKQGYDNATNPILMDKRAISGSVICERMLKEIDKIKQMAVPDEDKVSLFKEYVIREKAKAEELEMYEPIMSASLYDSDNLKEIEKKVL